VKVWPSLEEPLNELKAVLPSVVAEKNIHILVVEKVLEIVISKVVGIAMNKLIPLIEKHLWSVSLSLALLLFLIALTFRVCDLTGAKRAMRRRSKAWSFIGTRRCTFRTGGCSTVMCAGSASVTVSLD
jgi:hypothetical protein